MGWAQAFGFYAPLLGRALLLAVLVAMAVLPIAWTLGQLSASVLHALHVQTEVQAPVQMLQSASSLPTKLLIGLLALVVAPFAEDDHALANLAVRNRRHGGSSVEECVWGFT